ncbi:hypothetical protein RUR49_12415 [Pseudoxanthobacter sp. M-2]|uniref:hypothetical protein n=1 Tax=Pseudoxanthobacter sp. M-2 TaxID=3078754 RepID=UPI0038FC64E9
MADTVHIRNLQAIRARLVDRRREIAAADAASVANGYGAGNVALIADIQAQIAAIDCTIKDEQSTGGASSSYLLWSRPSLEPYLATRPIRWIGRLSEQL